jgi:hypothetical protein
VARKIEELYSDPKYDLVIFYFKERGILKIEDLAIFDFNDLSFVPGVDDDIISDVQAVYQNNCSTIELVEETTSNEFQSIKEELSTEEIMCVPDAFIADVYSCAPRSRAFIHNCNLQGKILMSQLSEEDFEQALGLKGLGASSVESLREISRQFANGESNIATSKEITVASRLDDISIERVFGEVPKGGLFIRHCHSIGIENIAQLQNFSFEEAQVSGIGVSSMKEIELAYLQVLRAPRESSKEPIYLENVAHENMEISIGLLDRIGVSKVSINVLNEKGYLTVKDMCQSGLIPTDYALIRSIIPYLAIPVNIHFTNLFSKAKDTYRKSLIQKSQGDTLQKIGDEIGVSRERVRQIIVKMCRDLMSSAEMISDTLMPAGKVIFSYSELQQLFTDPVLADCCKYVLLESSEILYLSFSDKFVRKSMCPHDLNYALQQFTLEVIGQGMNYYDNLETIQSELPKYGLVFLDFEDIMNYLVKMGYRFYGDYVSRSNQSYALICYDAISKYFPFDIKLDSDEKNEDILLLRKIIDKNYHGLILPENNRALTARIASFMVLSGRGRYCPIEKVIYNTSLLDELYHYIQNSTQTSFFYNELFAQFQGRFLLETNISNANFLHGVLKYVYPDEFNYERDLLVKNGASRQGTNDRLCELIISKKGPMTKSEILKAIPGLNDFVIAFAAVRLPKFIQWEFNVFNHIDNISCDSDDLAMLRQLITMQMKIHRGYISDMLLFDSVRQYYPQFIDKNRMTNSLNLFYVVGYFFEKDYRFRRPHILAQDFPVADLTVANIARTLLGIDTTLNYSDYVKLAESLGWAGGTLYSVFAEIVKDFIRISDDDYILRNAFNFSEDFLRETKQQIGQLVDSSGYFALSSIFNFYSFPDGPYNWNGFLLESIIEEYETGYKIITPQVRDRRYQRGIIVRRDDSAILFEDLVIGLLQKDEINILTEAELVKYMKNKGLITSVIPQELYECPALSFKNEVVTVKR